MRNRKFTLKLTPLSPWHEEQMRAGAVSWVYRNGRPRIINGIRQRTFIPWETKEFLTRQRMAKVDALSPEDRALVHEIGFTAFQRLFG